MKKSFLSFFIASLAFLAMGFQCEKDIVVSENAPGIYVIQINTAKFKGKIKPYFVETLATNKEVYDSTKAKLVVNAGFFDPKNQQTISFVTQNGDIALDPRKNTNLTDNPSLKPYMSKILNRSEFRIINCDGKITYDIAPHNSPAEPCCKIESAIQGGPALLPIPMLEEEFFILKKDGKIVSQSASSLMEYPRTAIGIKNNDIYLIIATTKAPMTLEAVSNYAKELGLEKAMAFDGGGSTSLDYGDLHVISDKNSTARKLKSFLIIE